MKTAFTLAGIAMAATLFIGVAFVVWVATVNECEKSGIRLF